MNPIEYLYEKATGFNVLSEDERDAIMHFSLLWSFFEAKALDNNASASRIIKLVHKGECDDHLNITPFAPILAYFRDRYFKHNEFTEDFFGLNLRNNDKPALVSAVLKGENTNPVDSIAALLIVVFRLRNNLFHGVKWADGICGQLDNFKNANAALIAVLETHDYL